MDVRTGESSDATRIRELARSAMTATYALGPRQLDTISEERFTSDSLKRTIGDDDSVVLVATNGESEGRADEDAVVGFVEGRVENARGELRWLFVDPERRGEGIGTRLFEAGTERLRESGVDHVAASVLDANTEGGSFFERLGLEETEKRQVEIGEESFVEHVYAESSAADVTDSESENADEGKSTRTDDVLDADLPGTESRDGTTLVRTEDGMEAYLDRRESESGTEGPFVVAYTDAEHAERYGYYCGNCGSLDTVVDESDRIECSDCGNVHVERSAEAYDGSYL